MSNDINYGEGKVYIEYPRDLTYDEVKGKLLRVESKEDYYRLIENLKRLGLKLGWSCSRGWQGERIYVYTFCCGEMGVFIAVASSIGKIYRLIANGYKCGVYERKVTRKELVPIDRIKEKDVKTKTETEHLTFEQFGDKMDSLGYEAKVRLEYVSVKKKGEEFITATVSNLKDNAYNAGNILDIEAFKLILQLVKTPLYKRYSKIRKCKDGYGEEYEFAVSDGVYIIFKEEKPVVSYSEDDFCRIFGFKRVFEVVN